MSLPSGNRENVAAASSTRHHCTPVRIAAGASSSPSTTCQPRNGYIFSMSALARSWRKSWRRIAGPRNSEYPVRMTVKMPSAGSSQPFLEELRPSGRPAHTANDARKIQVRKVNACPALMRFFQRNATAQAPVGRSVNGGDLRFFGSAAKCQAPPARTAAMRSANLRDNSTEASSNATSALTTHQ